jgi:hypothetical protein
MQWSFDVFRPLERFETLLADLYASFSERFGQDEEASRLFAGLSRISKTHKSQIEFLHKLAKSLDKVLPPPNLDVTRLTREIEAIERIRGMLEHVSLELAVLQALQLECGGAKKLSNEAIAPAHPDLAQMIRGFGPRRDAGNVGQLFAFAMKRGFSVPDPLAAAAHATMEASTASTTEAEALAAAAKKAGEEAAARRAAEEAEMEAAIKAGKNAIDYRLTKKKPL